MISHAYWIVLLPLISALTIFFFGRWLPMSGAVVGILSVGYGLLHSLGLFFKVLENPAVTEMSLPWFKFGIYQTELGVLVDGLSAVMLVVVTLVSFLVHVYSLGYMHGDPRFKRYYAYLSFFTFAMLLLVVANNFLQIFIGWELVGAASYLLIGFWFEKDSAASAGRKAFITTKLGDLGFFIAIMAIFSLLGTLNFGQVQGRIQDGLVSAQVAGVIALLLFMGAAGKSAQFPLHIWLPDAMEGPTPVSALIHAATMVAAGIYMIARSYFIFQHGAFSLEIIAWIGAITAFMAASMALVANDIKRVLAFSTVSQLGYMILSLGVGGRTAAMFHLTTHAFFKALLFLNAGSVIHAVHTNDIREMGGLSKKMLWTFWTFSFAWLAICGVWPFAGFYSKDAILEAAHHSGHLALFWIGVGVAFMTAFYMTRLYLMVFVTEPRNIEKFSHAHESPTSMVTPLVVLSVLAFGSGMLFQHVWKMETLLNPGETVSAHAGAPASGAVSETHGEAAASAAGHENVLPVSVVSQTRAEEPAGHAQTTPHWFVPVISSLAAFAGIFLAFLFYVKKTFSVRAVAKTFQPVHELLLRKYWVDEFYLYVFVKPGDALAAALSWYDYHVHDQIFVDGFAWITDLFSRVHNAFDKYVVDSLVDLWGVLAQIFGLLFRKAQTGLVQNYLFVFMAGVVAFVFFRLKISLADLVHLF